MIFITVLISVIVTLFVAIQDPIIQRFAVRFVGGYLSEKTGAEIKVGRIAVTPDFKVFVRDVTVKDLTGNGLVSIGALKTKIHVGDLLDGKIHLATVELSDTEANLVRYEGAEDFNFKFLADFFSSDKEKDPDKAAIPVFIDKILLSHIDFVFWDQNKDNPALTAQHSMDYAHIDLDDICLEANDFSMLGDSINVDIVMLKAKELSGLELKHLQAKTVVCRKGVFLDELQMESNNSLFHLDLNMRYNDFSAFSSFVDSVFFDATIYPTDLLLSDVGFFAPIMYEMPDRLSLEGSLTGPISHFSVDNLNASFGKMTSIKGNLEMHPLDFENGEQVLHVRNMRFSYDDLVNFRIPGKTGTIPIPQSLSAMETGNLKLYFKGSYNDFMSEIALTSDIGDVKASIVRSRQGEEASVFSGNIEAQGINAGLVSNSSKVVGKVDLAAGFSARFPKEGDPEIGLDGTVYHLELLGNQIDEIALNGDLKENRFKGMVNVDDDELSFDFNGLIDFRNAKLPKSDFEAVVRRADLRSLNLVKHDSISEIGTKIYVNMTGFDIDNLEGVLHIDSTWYRDSRGEYVMNSFDARIVNDIVMQRRINLDCDFFDFEMGGKFNFASLLSSLDEYGDYYVHFPIWEERVNAFQEYKLTHDVEQDFFMRLNLKDTKTLSRLFMPSLQIAKNTTVSGTFTSRSRLLNLTARTKGVQIGNLAVNDVELKNFNVPTASFGSLSVGEVVWSNITKTDTLSFGLDNLSFFAKMANDTISTRAKWNNVSEANHNNALIETDFHPHEKGGIFTIRTADVVINDTLWQVSPSNFIDLDTSRVFISNLFFSHGRQSIGVNGYVPMYKEDTITVRLNGFDISMLDVITKHLGYDIDGFITGEARIGNLKGEPMVLADLAVKGLGMNGDFIGDATLLSNWDNARQSVNVDMGIQTGDKMSLSVLGSYYTNKKDDNLDFDVKMDSLRLAVVTPFVGGAVSRIQGFGMGHILVKGSLKQPVLDGVLNIKDGGCKIGYLNTFYTFSPTITLDSKVIELKDMVLVDTLGNRATVDGKIYHNYLKDFTFDIKLHPRDFLVMATSLKDNDTFFGTVIANGLVSVKGPINDISLDAKALTRKGTGLTLPLNRVSTVSENDFVVFVDYSENEEEEEQQLEKARSNFNLNLDIDVTDDASIKLFLPGDVGTIDATGHGNVKLGTSTTDPLTLFGNYIINNGRFQLNFKNILNRTFNLRSGGTISWTGSPTDGRIDATGVYTVKTSLTSLGVQVDSTSSANSNINVECLIHLKDALLNPNITFGINLPNATEDVKQTVFSLIDTTNQAVMSEQALSLLVLGSFSYAANTSGSGSGTDAFSAIANNMLSGMTVELAKDFDLGVRYHTGSGYNAYDEWQIALKTELFENRLMIETNFGIVSDNNTSAESASNLVGEFDINYKLSKDGRLMAHFYNHSNYTTNYSSFAFDKLAPYTQGLGLTYSKSFNSFRDLFKRKKKVTTSGPLINRPKRQNAEKP